MNKLIIHKDPDRQHKNAVYPKATYREARVVTVRCKTIGSSVKPHQIMVFSNGEMHVMVNRRGFPGYVPAKEAGLTQAAACQAWKLSDFTRKQAA